MTIEIGYFVSPHGYGHATRAIAVVEALQEIRPDIHVHFFTTVTKSLFTETLSNFSYHHIEVDIGLVQNSALDFNIPATIDKLSRLYPLDKGFVKELSLICKNCSFIACDIAPLGIAVAELLEIPSILVENFTWDWIYHPYVAKYPQLDQLSKLLHNIFSRASYHIQTEPLCLPAKSDLHCGPIFRRKKGEQAELRQRFDCGDKKLVVITMGGIYQPIPNSGEIEQSDDILLLFSGQNETRRIGKNILLLERNSDIYHPDLLFAADLVVCKAGYSTIAECCQAGARVLSVGRADFPESAALQVYLEKKLGGITIKPEEYHDGRWLKTLSDLLSQPKPAPFYQNGASQVAEFLTKLL